MVKIWRGRERGMVLRQAWEFCISAEVWQLESELGQADSSKVIKGFLPEVKELEYNPEVIEIP